MPEPSGGALKDQDQPRDAGIEITSPSTRRQRAALFQLVILLAILVFALLMFLVATTPAFDVDLHITRAIQSIRSPVFLGLMRLISWPGFLPQSVIITLAIALVLYGCGLRWESMTCLLAALISGAAAESVKALIRRPRPGPDLVDVFAELTTFSFPSGHVMFYTILFGFVWYLAYTLLERSFLRSLVLLVAGGFILLVGVSRIYLGQHWASDVLGAYLLGGLILAGVVLLYRWGRSRLLPGR